MTNPSIPRTWYTVASWLPPNTEFPISSPQRNHHVFHSIYLSIIYIYIIYMYIWSSPCNSVVIHEVTSGDAQEVLRLPLSQIQLTISRTKDSLPATTGHSIVSIKSYQVSIEIPLLSIFYHSQQQTTAMSIVLTQSATVSFPGASEASACNGPLERPKRPCLAA